MKSLVLDVYQEIGADYFGDGLTAKTVKAQIDAGGEFDEILVNINSPGGDAFEGVAIKNLIEKQNKPTRVEIDGLAASAASIIAMCGDVTMRAGSMLMIHDAWSICVGNGADMAKMAQTLNKISQGSIAQCYAARTGLDLQSIIAMMQAETWMDADEALERGFCSNVAKSEKKVKAFAKNKSVKALAKFHYKNVPQKLMAAVCDCDCGACGRGDCDECTNAQCDSPDCDDCPMQNSGANNSNLSLYKARFAALSRGVQKV